MGDYLRRVEALEDQIDPPPSANMIHIVICEQGETSEEACARHFKAYPAHPAAHVIVINTRAVRSGDDDVQ